MSEENNENRKKEFPQIGTSLAPTRFSAMFRVYNLGVSGKSVDQVRMRTN